MAVLNIAPRTTALAAAIALLAPGVALAQTAADSSMSNSLTTDQLNQQMLMMLQQDPSALMPADQAMTGQAGTAAMPDYGDDVQIFEDAEGNRYVRADTYDRMMAARGGTAGSGSYQPYVDDQGVRYYQLGPNEQPMMGTGPALSRTLEDPSLRTSPEYEDEVEVFEDDQGNRFMRVGVDNRIVGAPVGSPMASMDVSGYPIYQDAQGYRYIRVDANNQPMMTSLAD